MYARWIVVLLLVLAIPMTVAAQSDRDEEARRMFESGRLAFDGGHFEDARDAFDRAYELSGRPLLLYNIGQANEMLDENERAIAAYHRYLDERPDAPNRDEVERQILHLSRSVSSPEPQQLRESENDAPAARREPVERSEPETSNPRTWTWVTGSLTLALGSLALAGRFISNARYDDLVTRCAVAGCTETEIQDSGVRRWDRITVSSLIAASALLVGFVIALVVERPDRNEVRVSMGIQSLAIEGTF